MTLTKREKVILLIVLGAALYGLYSLVLGPSSAGVPDHSQAELNALNQLIDEIAKEMDSAKSESTGAYILGKAATEWSAKPFLPKGLPSEVKEEKKSSAHLAREPEWHFSGYLETPTRCLAVINGLEYEEGDWLEEVGYRVAQIFPTHVVVETLDTQTRSIVPLEETLEVFDSKESSRIENEKRAISDHEI
jgi:hypothetical protein